MLYYATLRLRVRGSFMGLIVKNYKRLESILLVTFIVSWLGLWIYLLFYHSNWIIFLILIFSAIFSLIYQIFFTSLSRIILYCEVFLLSLGIQLINPSYVTTKVFGLDTYKELTSTVQILRAGHWDSSLPPIGTTPYPVVHIFGATLNLVASVSILTIAQWTGLFLRSILLIFYFLLVRKLSGNDSVTLLASLALITTYPYAMNANFGRQAIAIFLFIFLLYLIFKENIDTRYIVISILIAIALVFSHHLTRVIVILYLTLFLIVDSFLGRTRALNSLVSAKSMVFYTGIILVVGTLAYFVYFKQITQYLLKRTLFLLLFGKLSVAVTETSLQIPIYRKIFLWGTFVSLQVFIFVFLYSPNKTKGIKVLDLHNIIFTETIHVLSKLSKIVLIPFTYYRALLFTAPFILLTWSHAIFSNKLKNTTFKKIAGILLVAYIVFNVIGYPPYIYDKSLQPNYNHVEWRRYLNFQEISAVKSFDPQIGEVIGDYYIYVARMYFDNKDNTIMNTKFFTEGYKSSQKLFWLYFRKSDLQAIFMQDMKKITKVSEKTYMAYHLFLNEVYNNGYVEVFSNLKST